MSERDEWDDPLGADVGWRQVASMQDGTTRTPIPRAVPHRVFEQPGTMGSGTAAVQPGKIAEGVGRVAVGSHALPRVPRTADDVYAREMVSRAEVTPGGSAVTTREAIPSGPARGTIEHMPPYVVEGMLRNSNQMPPGLAQWLYALAIGQPPTRPPASIVRLLAMRADGGPLVAYCNQLNHALDAHARAGVPVRSL